MENNSMPQTPPKVTMEIECKTTPTPTPNELRKLVTPDHLKLPKPFKYPERYTSPTDMMMSPVTKVLLARNKKAGAAAAAALLPPKYQPKVPDMCLKDVSLLGEFNST